MLKDTQSVRSRPRSPNVYLMIPSPNHYFLKDKLQRPLHAIYLNYKTDINTCPYEYVKVEDKTEYSFNLIQQIIT